MARKTKLLTEEEYLAILNDADAEEPEEAIVLWDSSDRRIMVWTLWEKDEEEDDEEESEQDEVIEEEQPTKKRRGWFS